MGATRPSKDEGIDATNRDYLRYEQVEKIQRYGLAERGTAELFDEQTRVRTCDMQSPGFPDELGTALEELGFAILVGHGLDPALFAACAEELPHVFERPLEEKLRFRAARHGAVNQGYFPIEQTTDIHPDLVEGWVFARRAFDLAGDTTVGDFWPAPRSEAVFRRLCAEGERLILPLMRAVLTYLGCDPHLYDERLTDPSFALRLNYYPPIDVEQDAGGAGRLLGHEDVDLFTLLPAPTSEGLQVLNRRNFRWIRLDAPPDSIVLNTGDYMQRITNDRLPSTTHRVSKPRAPELLARTRVTFPMNVYLWERETLEVLPGLGTPKYEPVGVLPFHTATTAKYYGDDYAVPAD